MLRQAYDGGDMGQPEAVTVRQAVLLYTGRARQVAPLDGVGLIDIGCEASFVVLDRDLFDLPTDEIDQVQVNETWLRGERAYLRADRAD